MAIIVVSDITKRKQEEDEIVTSFASLNKRIVKYDIRERKLYISNAQNEVYELEDVLDNMPYAVWDNDFIKSDTDKQRYVEFYESIIQGEKTGMIELPFVDAKGKERIELLEFSTIFDESGNRRDHQKTLP